MTGSFHRPVIASASSLGKVGAWSTWKSLIFNAWACRKAGELAKGARSHTKGAKERQAKWVVWASGAMRKGTAHSIDAMLAIEPKLAHGEDEGLCRLDNVSIHH